MKRRYLGKLHHSFSVKKIAISSMFIFAITFLFIGGNLQAAGVFGNGVDGSATISATTHLASDMEYVNLTVDAGGIIETHGFIIRVSGTLNNSGIIRDSFSGGNGGSGGSGGLGGRFYDGHISPQFGSSGFFGSSASVSGGGQGGRGGGGGGGGGGGWDNTWNAAGNGGRGGNGGSGGKGGGVVTIYAQSLNNFGTIHADGSAGGNANSGSIGGYDSYNGVFFISRDVAGGGGGGGAGGIGGNGGSVKVVYQNIVFGSIHATGGTGGARGFGGSGRNTNYSSSTAGNEESGRSGGGSPFGGTGGRGETSSAQSNNGGNGQNGSTGSTGSVSAVLAIICYTDADGDGFGDANDPGTPTEGNCGAGFVTNNIDCDDTDNSIYPGAPELCDGIDNDCDGQIPANELDNDNDGFSVCAGDCDDGDPSTYPNALELCDGIDNDCDGQLPANELDNDGDSFTVCQGDCNDVDATVYPGAVEIPGDGVDQNCDGFDDVICFADADGDTYGDIASPLIATGSCPPGNVSDNSDCDDADDTINPSAVDILDDGIDQDCDGIDATCCVVRGDVNHDGGLGISDITYTVDYLFNGGPVPSCDKEADVNSDLVIGISDLTFLVDYLFNNGSAPSGC